MDASFLKSDAKEQIFCGIEEKRTYLWTPLNTVYNKSMIISQISYYNYGSYSYKHKKRGSHFWEPLSYTFNHSYVENNDSSCLILEYFYLYLWEA